MLGTPFAIRFSRVLTRAIALAGVLVLVCVPALTRVGQRLETSSLAPSFSRTVECPPKKVAVAPVVAVALPMMLSALVTVPLARVAPAPDTTLPRSPNLAVPRPLRAPPSQLFA